jgi:molybdenum cofactor synthesis domain-containing protein
VRCGKADPILTTGCAGPSPRDLTPEAMTAVMEKEPLGFGEMMRRVSLSYVPTAILSRQTAGTRGKNLIINVPGKPFPMLAAVARINRQPQFKARPRRRGTAI